MDYSINALHNVDQVVSVKLQLEKEFKYLYWEEGPKNIWERIFGRSRGFWETGVMSRRYDAGYITEHGWGGYKGLFIRDKKVYELPRVKVWFSNGITKEFVVKTEQEARQKFQQFMDYIPRKITEQVDN
jgi:hypothetical protein